MKKVIWLASWFPTEERPLPGDFIERHARAVSRYLPVYIIHVTRIHYKNSRSGKFIKQYKHYPSLKAEIYSFRLPQFLGMDLLISYCYSLLLYIKRIKAYARENGKPDLLHVHVSLRCGLVALYFKWVLKIPFIISEHNGALLKEAENYGAKIGFAENLLSKMVLKHATAITVVSETLRKAIVEKFGVTTCEVVPNVVDTAIFNPLLVKKENRLKTFLHVSTLSPGKNVDLILRAFALVKSEFGHPFCFKVIGPHSEALKLLAQDLGIIDEVEWLTETDQQGVARQMQQVDAVILYSSYESFGCVNIEANATGIPAIVSDINTFREYLYEGINAVFAGSNDVPRLAKVIAAFVQGEYRFDPSQIVMTVQKFSYAEIGRRFNTLYQSI